MILSSYNYPPKSIICFSGVVYLISYIKHIFYIKIYFLHILLHTLILVVVRIERIEIFEVKLILNDSKAFAETLEMYDFTLTQESDWVGNFRVFYETENVVVGCAGFLLCCHVFMQIGDRVSF